MTAATRRWIWRTENDNPAIREALLRAEAGQTERQRTAARGEDNSGPGFFDFAVAAIGGTAIAAAGGGTDEAVAAGGVFAGGVLSGNPPAGNARGGLDPGVSSPAGNTGITAGAGHRARFQTIRARPVVWRT